MTRRFSLISIACVVTLLFAGLCVFADDADKLTLKVGDTAPAFSLMGSDGKTHSLKDFAGKQTVVVAWFPKAFTGGCTAECKSMHEHGDAIRAYDVAYFTASVDDAETNKKFAESLKLDYPILSDPDKATAKAYGVFLAGYGVANRVTFYIGPDGKIQYVDHKVSPATAAEDIAKRLEALKVPKRKS
jgi:peroxiredoxin Q/BCP